MPQPSAEILDKPTMWNIGVMDLMYAIIPIPRLMALISVTVQGLRSELRQTPTNAAHIPWISSFGSARRHVGNRSN